MANTNIDAKCELCKNGLLDVSKCLICNSQTITPDYPMPLTVKTFYKKKDFNVFIPPVSLSMSFRYLPDDKEESLISIVEHAVKEQQKKSETLDKQRTEKCSHGVNWTWCAKCNPDLKRNECKIETCDVQDLKDGIQQKMKLIEDAKQEYNENDTIDKKMEKLISSYFDKLKIEFASEKTSDANETEPIFPSVYEREKYYKVEEIGKNIRHYIYSNYGEPKAVYRDRNYVFPKRPADSNVIDMPSIEILEPSFETISLKPEEPETRSLDLKQTAIQKNSENITESISENIAETISEERTSENIQQGAKLSGMEYPRILKSNLICLQDVPVMRIEAKFLNDSVIEFYLSYIFNEKLTPSQQKKTFIANTFFYKQVEKEIVAFEKDKQYPKKGQSQVLLKKKIDLFKNEAILIPINEGNHWYLIIIVSLPQLLKKNSDSENKIVEEKYEKEKPGIYFFDSFFTGMGDPKNRKVEVLITFLNRCLELKQANYTFDWRKLIGRPVICQKQEDGFNCGVFLLQYAEFFFQVPLQWDHNGFPYAAHWFSPAIIPSKRQKIKEIIEYIAGFQTN